MLKNVDIGNARDSMTDVSGSDPSLAKEPGLQGPADGIQEESSEPAEDNLQDEATGKQQAQLPGSSGVNGDNNDVTDSHQNYR